MRQRIARKSPYILAQSAVPVCLAPNGTVATNGTITLGTALPTTYSGGIWLRLPANAVVGGAAGLYWAVMSSTTVGQVYTAFADPASPFTPYIPSGALTNAVGSNAAYTQTTAADVTLVNVTLPGGAMGPNGVFRMSSMFQHNNSAGTKTPKYILGGTTLLARGRTTSVAENWGPLSVRNRGVLNRNVSPAGNTAGAGQDFIGAGASGHNLPYSIDTAVDQSAVLSGQLGTATDYLVCDGFTFEILPS